MNAPNEHQRIRALLSLAASGALDSAEEMIVESHLRNCPECAAELEHWQTLAAVFVACPPLSFHRSSCSERLRLSVKPKLRRTSAAPRSKC